MTVAAHIKGKKNKKLVKESMKNPNTRLITIVQKIKMIKCKKCKHWSPATKITKGEKGTLIVLYDCWKCRFNGKQIIKKSQRVKFRA